MRDRRRESTLLALLVFGNFIIGMGAFVVVGVVTPVAEGLGISQASVGIIMTTYAVACALISPIGASITGTISRRIVLAGALVLFAVGSLASALSPNLTMLAASRIVVAMGSVLFTPIAAGVVVAESAPERRGEALATVFGGITLAQVVGVPVGAWLAYRFGWPSAFWAVAVLAAVGASTMFFAIPKDTRFQVNGLDAIATVLKDFRILFATAFTATFMGATYIVLTYLGPLIEASVGSNAEARTGYLVLYGLGAVAGNFAGGYLDDHIGARRTLIVICLGQAVIMMLFAITPWPPVVFAVLVAGWAAFSWSFMAPQQSRLVALAPQVSSLVLSFNAAMIYVGIAVGSGVGSTILHHLGLAALGIAGGLGALAALAHLLASGRK